MAISLSPRGFLLILVASLSNCPGYSQRIPTLLSSDNDLELYNKIFVEKRGLYNLKKFEIRLLKSNRSYELFLF